MPEVPYISLSELLSTYKAVVEEAFQGRYWEEASVTCALAALITLPF